MVTHENDLAACADRIVTIKDGRVLSNRLLTDAEKEENRKKLFGEMEQADVAEPQTTVRGDTDGIEEPHTTLPGRQKGRRPAGRRKNRKAHSLRRTPAGHSPRKREGTTMKRKNDFAEKLLAVCLALVLAAGMLAVPAMATGAATPSPANSTVPGGGGEDNEGEGNKGDNNNPGSNGITGGMPYITGYTVAPQLGVAGELQRIQPRAEVLHHREHLRPALYKNVRGKEQHRC